MSLLIKTSTGNFDAMRVCPNKNEMGWGYGVCSTWGDRSVGHTGVLVGKHEIKKRLGRPRRRCEDNNKNGPQRSRMGGRGMDRYGLG